MDTWSLLHAMRFISAREQSKIKVYVIAKDEQYKVDYSKLPVAVISNDMEKKWKGNHWVLWLVFNSNSKGSSKECKYSGVDIQFFCSYGLSPTYYNLDFPKISNVCNFVYNSTQLQPETSTTCGIYCLYFLYKRLKGFSVLNVVSNEFKRNSLKENDQIVLKFYNLLCCNKYLTRRAGKRCMRCRPRCNYSVSM